MLSGLSEHLLSCCFILIVWEMWLIPILITTFFGTINDITAVHAWYLLQFLFIKCWDEWRIIEVANLVAAKLICIHCIIKKKKNVKSNNNATLLCQQQASYWSSLQFTVCRCNLCLAQSQGLACRTTHRHRWTWCEGLLERHPLELDSFGSLPPNLLGF